MWRGQSGTREREVRRARDSTGGWFCSHHPPVTNRLLSRTESCAPGAQPPGLMLEPQLLLVMFLSWIRHFVPSGYSSVAEPDLAEDDTFPNTLRLVRLCTRLMSPPFLLMVPLPVTLAPPQLKR